MLCFKHPQSYLQAQFQRLQPIGNTRVPSWFRNHRLPKGKTGTGCPAQETAVGCELWDVQRAGLPGRWTGAELGCSRVHNDKQTVDVGATLCSDKGWWWKKIASNIIGALIILMLINMIINHLTIHNDSNNNSHNIYIYIMVMNHVMSDDDRSWLNMI